MALTVELKPNERIVIGTAVIRNGDTRSRFAIEGDAPILREKDIVTGATADTPAKTIYLAVQLMYLSGGDISAAQSTYIPLIREFLAAAPSALAIVDEMSRHVLDGNLYRALRSAKALIAYEKELMAHAQRRSGRLCEDGPDHALAASA